MKTTLEKQSKPAKTSQSSAGRKITRRRSIADASKFRELFSGEGNSGSIQEILLAALENFSSRGYRATTTRDIAKSAGLSPAALYIHFRSKEDVLYRIVHVVNTAFFTALASADYSNGSETERLYRLTRKLVSLTAELKSAIHIANYEIGELSGTRRAAIADIRSKMTDMFSSCLERGNANGEFAVPDVHTTTIAILSLAQAVSRWYQPDGRLKAAELADYYADIVLRMAGAQKACEFANENARVAQRTKSSSGKATTVKDELKAVKTSTRASK
jgi:AcrR family transcriptional regulator